MKALGWFLLSLVALILLLRTMESRVDMEEPGTRAPRSLPPQEEPSAPMPAPRPMAASFDETPAAPPKAARGAPPAEEIRDDPSELARRDSERAREAVMRELKKDPSKIRRAPVSEEPPFDKESQEPATAPSGVVVVIPE